MIDYRDPIMDNYYALLLAIVYPYFLTSEEALAAIKHGMNPIRITGQTLDDALNLSKMRKIPRYFTDYVGRQYEAILFLADVINETNKAMQGLRDYELSKFRVGVTQYMSNLRERMEQDKIR